MTVQPFAPRVWPEQAEAFRKAKPVPGYTVDGLRADVLRGDVGLIDVDGAAVLALTLDGHALHIEGLAGKVGGFAGIAKVHAYVVTLARTLGRSEVTAATNRPGMAAYLERLGYAVAEPGAHALYTFDVKGAACT